MYRRWWLTRHWALEIGSYTFWQIARDLDPAAGVGWCFNLGWVTVYQVYDR